MRDKLGAALEINPRYFYDSDLYSAEDIMFLLFELDSVHKIELNSFQNGKKTRMNIHIGYNLVDDFLADWQKKKQALATGELTDREYTEWILTWPRSANKPKDEVEN